MTYVPSMNIMRDYNSKQLYRKRRTPDLNDFALQLGVYDYKEYKNKKELICKILELNVKPSYRCYNKTDPCTLEDIDSISFNELIEWNQFGKHFGANIYSLKTLFDNKRYILPWSVDFVNGFDKSSNIEKYNIDFDMRNVSSLMETIDKCTNDVRNEMLTNSDLNNSFFMFEIDKIMGGENYSYGFIINKILNNNVTSIYILMCDAMYTTYLSLCTQQHIYNDIFYQFVYLHYSMKGCNILDKKLHLQFLIEVFRNLKEVIGDKALIILNLMFMDMES